MSAEPSTGSPVTAPPSSPAGAPAEPSNRPNGKHAPLLGRKQKIRARKVQRIVRHVEPWSVLKISLLFYFCLFLILLVASVVLWSVGRSTGTVDNVESFITELGFGNCAVEDELPPGTRFEEDDGCAETGRVLVGSFRFEDEQLLQGVAVGGLVLVLAGATANTLLAVLFNLMSDLTGGVRLTVLEEEGRPRKAAPKPASAPPG